MIHSTSRATIQVSNSLTRPLVLPALSRQSTAMPPKASITNRYCARRLSPAVVAAQPVMVLDGTAREPSQLGWSVASLASVLMVVFLAFMAAH